MEGMGTIIGVWYLGNYGSPVTAQNYGYDHFLLAANGYGTIHPIPNMAPPLPAEEEGPPT
jgi:hypothetical protein